MNKTSVAPSHCANCGALLADRYCGRCGQDSHVALSLGHFLHEIVEGLFHVDSRFWSTLRAVKPMQNIDSIRIMQVDGLNAGAASVQTGDGVPGTAAGNLAEQAVGAALKYRAYAPVVAQLIKEVGLSGDGLGGLVKIAPPAAPASVAAVQK